MVENATFTIPALWDSRPDSPLTRAGPIPALFFAIPTFVLLISLEAWVAKIKGVKINRPVDMISSISSGITNTVRDGIKFSFVIISYSWLVENIAIYKLTPIWLAVVIAFVVEDFAGYWMHRLNHRVNIFWNRHIIHHSSEDCYDE